MCLTLKSSNNYVFSCNNTYCVIFDCSFLLDPIVIPTTRSETGSKSHEHRMVNGHPSGAKYLFTNSSSMYYQNNVLKYEDQHRLNHQLPRTSQQNPKCNVKCLVKVVQAAGSLRDSRRDGRCARKVESVMCHAVTCHMIINPAHLHRNNEVQSKFSKS